MNKDEFDHEPDRDARCGSCDEPIASTAKFCPYCGGQTEHGRQAASRKTQIQFEPPEALTDDGEAAATNDGGHEGEGDAVADSRRTQIQFERADGGTDVDGTDAEPEVKTGAGETEIQFERPEDVVRADPAADDEIGDVGTDDRQGEQAAVNGKSDEAFEEKLALSETLPGESVELDNDLDEEPDTGGAKSSSQPRYAGVPNVTKGGSADDSGETASEEFETDFDIDTSEFTGPRRLVGGVLVAVLALTAIGFGVWLDRADAGGDTDAEATAEADRDDTAESEEASTSESSNEAVPETETLADQFDVEVGGAENYDHRMARLQFDGDEVLRLYTPRGTPHDSLQERSQAVMMRLAWAAQRHRTAAASGTDELPELQVRRKGEKYEVQWKADGRDAVWLLAVSREDVRHWREAGRETAGRAALAREFSRKLEGFFEGLITEGTASSEDDEDADDGRT